MAPIDTQTLEKDVFQSTFLWFLKNFCVMIDAKLFNSGLTTTEEIPIKGIPFKWQLGMTIGENTIYDRDRRGNVPAVRFNLDFIGDGPVPEKYKNISCDFEIGSCWKGTADLFPSNARKTELVKQSTLREMSSLYSEGTLGLLCFMKVNAYFIESKPSNLAIKDSRSYVMKLNKDIGVLLGNEKHSDVTIVVKDQEFKAHKFILAARSPVFSLMLETDMKEKLESCIEIPGVSVEAVKEFLKFLYMGEVSTAMHWNDLLNLAEMYQIEDLKEVCGRMIITQLNKENALENLFFANLHNCEELKQKAFEMITQQILGGKVPDDMMNKPEAVEQLMLAKLNYDNTLQRAKLEYDELLQESKNV